MIFSGVSENKFVRKAPPVKSDNLINNVRSGKRCEIGCALVLFINR